MKEKIIKLLEEVLELDEESIELDDEFRDYDEWNSLAYLGIVAEIDSETGVVIPTEEFKKLITVHDLIDFIDNVK